ncbi:MAG: regulatory protein ToxS [Vibrio hibernica]
MKKIITIIALAGSIIFSSWAYWHSDFKLKHLLESREWQSVSIAHMSEWESSSSIDKARILSNVKYLPNGTYLKISALSLYSKQLKDPAELSISESGQWDLSDNYIIITPKDFKDTSSISPSGLPKKQLDKITELFKMSSQQSRKIDVINDNTLLFTTLGNGSTVLFSQ